MTYQVAIPSLGRPARCAATIDNLIAGGVDTSRITVFLSDHHETDAYLEAGIKANLAAGAMGIAANRNAITAHYPHGTRVVSVDDDITRVLWLAPGQSKLAPFAALHEFFTQAWDLAGVRLWGINPTGNGFYMKPTPHVKLGLIFAIGCLHGYTVDHNMPALTIEAKEDYERTLLYWHADGAVARFDWMTTNNRYAGTPGGLGTDREQRNTSAVQALTQRWPGLVQAKSPTEVKLKAIRVRLAQ